MPLALALSPEGRLIPDDRADESFAFAEADAAIARLKLEQGSGALLLWLASWKSPQGLPPSGVFWREFAGVFFTSFCRHGGTAGALTSDGLRLMEKAPPMLGGEYLTPQTLEKLWANLSDETELARAGVGAGDWLRTALPHWHLVGRVMFHLAENKKDPDRPFAFLATYTSGLNPEGKPRHLPLGQAVKEFAGANNRTALLNLLEPVHLAAQKSDWTRELIDSGGVYRPQAWVPREALRFLKEVPQFEEAGLAVRIPDWWKPDAPPRPQVTVTVGETKPASFSLGKLLGFTIELTLHGEKLTREELQAIKTAQGLVLVKGKWVEADAEKLEAVLNHWHTAQLLHFSGGISFLQAMRLLSGATIDAADQQTLTADAREWSGLEAGEWLTELLKEMRSPARLAEFAVHPELKATLRPYQIEGVHWLHFMCRLGLGACLADDMGLGKTIQLLALLLHLRSEPGPSLLVAPASLIANWKAEAERFAPTLRLLIAHPSGEEAGLLSEFEEGKLPPGVDLVVTTYGMLSRSEAFAQTQWRTLILDEAQAIKNPASAQTQTVKKLQADMRIALTGTPVENRLADLWSIFDFLNPGLLGNAAEFGRFAKSLVKESGANYTPLRTLVRPYILRRLKTDKRVIGDLPDKTELDAWCLLTRPQAVLYEQSVQRLAAAIANAEGVHRRGLILAALNSFKQICNHPAQHSGDAHYDPAQSGKFKRLRALCETIAERQERVLIFTQFTEIIPALRNFLAGIFGRDGLVLTGETPVQERRQLVEAFQGHNGPPFFLLSLKAGGTGLTLTAANHVIHFDRWWNPAVENQATDRAYRIGQKRNVLVHKFVCRGTLEEKIHAMLLGKRDLAEGVLAEGTEVPLTELSDAELIQFVSLDMRQVEGSTK